MEVKSHEMSGEVFHGCLTVLGWTRMKGSRRYLAVECSICAKDPELFGDGVFETTKESISSKGYLPCGCGWAYKWSEQQIRLRCLRRANEHGFSFNGFSEDFRGVRTKCSLSFGEEHWTCSVSQFLSRPKRTFTQGLKTKDDKEMIESFLLSGVFDPETKFSRERKFGKWYWRVECPVCGSEGVSQPQHLQRGCRPCLCGNYKQKYSYVNMVVDGNLPIALKFGVSRSKSMRLQYQARKTPYDIESYGVWEYDTKEDCAKAERLCLESMECGILPKSNFGDGYTETTHVYNLERIVEIFESFGGIRIKDS